MNELFDLSGKVIVVTGATGVLAGGTAQYLQKNGATVVYLGRNQQKVDDVLAVAQQISADCMSLTADVLDEEKLSMAYERIMNQYGRIDACLLYTSDAADE